MKVSTLTWACLLGVVRAQCPSHCTCNAKSVLCTAGKLNAVPQNLPANATLMYATGNFIRTLPEDAFSTSSLLYLSLQSNGIATVKRGAFRGLVRLSSLDLAYNLLTTLEEGVFDTLQELEELYLQYNKLKVIRKYTFRNLTSLHTLDLSYNRLKTLDVWWFLNMNDVQYVNLAENPLVCDCGVRDVWLWSTGRRFKTGFNCTGKVATEDECVRSRPPTQVLALPTLSGFLSFAAIFLVSYVVLNVVAGL